MPNKEELSPSLTDNVQWGADFFLKSSAVISAKGT
jgi:hypothetical protein